MFAGENYETFISESKEHISGNKCELDTSRVFKNINENYLKSYADVEKSIEQLNYILQKPLEDLDLNLSRFDHTWTQKNGKLFWSVDYNNIIGDLQTIIWENGPKTYYYNENHYNHIWNEIGLFRFLKKEKLTFSENAGIQFFDVDKIIVDDGKLLILGDEKTVNRLGNGSINIFAVGIEQILNSLYDAELYTEFLLNNKVNEISALHPVLYTPSAKNKDYLFIIDNMRSSVMSFKKQRQALTCLHCGRCEKVCPVAQIAGNNAYNNIFSGPLANILLPHLETPEEYKFVSYACILCGECEKVCPINLPLREMILENRKYLVENKIITFSENKELSKLRKFMLNRSKMNRSRVYKYVKYYRCSTKSLRKNRKHPAFEKQTFNQQYIKHLKESKNI